MHPAAAISRDAATTRAAVAIGQTIPIDFQTRNTPVSKETEPFAMIMKQVLDSKAWRNMSMGARVLYVSLRRRYWKDRHNNGRIYLSQRNASIELGRSTTQITRWFRELQHYGFIVQTQRGSLGTDGVGKAPHWRLTECGYHKEPPTQDFLRWNGTPFRDTAAPLRGLVKSRMVFCAGCGAEFKRTRNDARYCTSSCRSKANRKRIPVPEIGDTYVPEIGDTAVSEIGDSATDKRPRNRGHMQRLTVREIGDISSIPSVGTGDPPRSVPAIPETDWTSPKPKRVSARMTAKQYRAFPGRLN